MTDGKKAKDDPPKDCFGASTLPAFLFIAAGMLLLGAPYICRSTMVLIGPVGLAFWMLLYGLMILGVGLVIAITIQSILKDKTIKKHIFASIFCIVAVIFVVRPHVFECLNVIQDVVGGSVEVIVTDYEMHYVSYAIGGRGGTHLLRLCYQISTESPQGVDRIVFPIKTFDQYASSGNEQLPFSVRVYPHTGILADREALNVIISSVEPFFWP